MTIFRNILLQRVAKILRRKLGETLNIFLGGEDQRGAYLGTAGQTLKSTQVYQSCIMTNVVILARKLKYTEYIKETKLTRYLLLHHQSLTLHAKYRHDPTLMGKYYI